MEALLHDEGPAANGPLRTADQDVTDTVPTGPYQLLPPLAEAEYTALRDDIEAHGIRVPVDVDEHGQILDGHHRAAIAAALGIPCPTRVLAGLTEEDKREHAMALNLARRHLTQADRRQLIVAELEHDDTRSDRRIARVVGVDHKTVGAVRRALRGESPHPDVETVSTLEPLTAAEIVQFAEAEQVVAAGFEKLDHAIVFALSNRIDPMLIVGWLTTAKYRAAEAFAEDTEIATVLMGMYDSCIAHLLRRGKALQEQLAGPDICVKPLTTEEVADLAAALSGGAA